MKWIARQKAILLFAAILLSGVAFSGTAQAYTDVSFSFGFHDALAPYGTWVSVSNYGNCWRPAVAAGWVPYSYGHWDYTSYGPTWAGTEPYAWATYHYGHWVFSEAYGWIWVPGYTWSPANVVWSYGDGYIGWRPSFPAGYASYGGVDANQWVFINANRFGYSNYAGARLRPAEVRSLFDRRAVRIASAPLRRTELERIVRRPVRVVAVRERIVNADNHRVRLVVPATQEKTVIERISRISRHDNVRTTPVARSSKMVTTTKTISSNGAKSRTTVTTSSHGTQSKSSVKTYHSPHGSMTSTKSHVTTQKKTYTPSRKPEKSISEMQKYSMKSGNHTMVSHSSRAVQVSSHSKGSAHVSSKSVHVNTVSRSHQNYRSVSPTRNVSRVQKGRTQQSHASQPHASKPHHH